MTGNINWPNFFLQDSVLSVSVITTHTCNNYVALLHVAYIAKSIACYTEAYSFRRKAEKGRTQTRVYIIIRSISSISFMHCINAQCTMHNAHWFYLLSRPLYMLAPSIAAIFFTESSVAQLQDSNKMDIKSGVNWLLPRSEAKSICLSNFIWLAMLLVACSGVGCP